MTNKEAIEWLERIEERYILNGDEGFDKARKEALHMAIEALERKHGEWLETSESIGWEEVGCAECSVCGKTLVLGDYTMDDIKFDYNYCPYCGSRMDERREDER